MTAPSEPQRAEGSQSTEALAADVAQRLKPGDLVLVAGEVGTGKTTFVRGACRALGVTDRVTSPTFVLVHRYEGRVAADGARLEVAHLDLHRLGEAAGGPSADDLDLLGEEHDGRRIVFVEHPAVAGDAFEALHPRVHVHLAHAGPQARDVTIAFVAA